MLKLDSSSADGVYATFRGELDQARARDLFGRRSIWDRCLGIVQMLLIFAVVLSIVWVLKIKADERTTVFPFLVVMTAGVCGFLWWRTQVASSMAQVWQKVNGVLAGPYEVVLADEYFDVRSSSLAKRLPYWILQGADSGLLCVRMKLDATGHRAVLLPTEDCIPPRTAAEVQAYIRERIRACKAQKLSPSAAALNAPPEPFSLTGDVEHVDYFGALRKAEVLNALLSEESKRPHARIQRVAYWMLGIAGVGLVIVLLAGFGAKVDREAQQEMTDKVVALGLLAVIGICGMVARARVRSDPEASAATVRGRVSSRGFVVIDDASTVAVAWTACDSIEFGDAQFIAKLWQGELMIFSRHLFGSDADWNRVVKWARAAQT